MGGKRVAWGGQEKKLYDICCETPIDWDGVKRLIEVDADVNACEPRDDEDDDDETLLGEIAMNGFYAKQGLPTLVKLFIENGFQTQKLGHSAIRAICSSTYDRQMFDAVKLIVQNGISDAPKEYEETLDIIGWKQAGEDGVYRDYRLYDVYEAMRELVIAARDGRSVDGIDIAESCIGGKIDGIVQMGKRASVRRTDEKTAVFTGDIAFLTGGHILLMKEEECLLVNDNCLTQTPYVRADNLFGVPIVGKTIQHIVYALKAGRKEKSDGSTFAVDIILDDGTEIWFANNFSEAGCEGRKSWFEIKDGPKRSREDTPFSGLEGKLCEALLKEPSDWQEAERLIAAGADVNAVDPEIGLPYDDGSLLGWVISEREERPMTEIIRFFLNHGWDSRTYGHDVLAELVYHEFCPTLLNSVKLVLDSGISNDSRRYDVTVRQLDDAFVSSVYAVEHRDMRPMLEQVYELVQKARKNANA